MKLSEIWKEKMISSLVLLYGSKINKEALSNELDRIIKLKESQFPNLIMRNLYTDQNISVPLDDILDIVHKEDLCIEANNTLTYSFRKIKSPIPIMLMESKSERNVHKNKAKQLDSEISKLKSKGEFVEGCDLQIKQLLEEALQLKVKQFMNSIYGVQGQRGSIIYNPDTASAVTSQGRQMISEMLWTMERLLYGTVHFTDFGEYLLFLDTIQKGVHRDSPLLNYITYIPTRDECVKLIASQVNKITDVDKVLDKIELPLFNYINSLDDIGRIYFYYKNNLSKLISRNHKVFDLFESIINSPTKFMATGSGTPDEFKPALNEMHNLIDEFILCRMSTPKRVFKYQNKRRRGIIISDTDSVIINLNPHVQNLWKLHCLRNNIPIDGRSISFIDEDMDFKLVNIMSDLCVHSTEIAGDVFCGQGNVPDELRKWCEMKNEFLFKRVIMYKNAKKNYVCHVRLREGNYKNDIATTGIKINSSTINEQVKEQILDIVENDILKSEYIDPIKIFRKQKDIERYIIHQVKSGDFTFGKKSRFSGMKGYKTGIYQNNAGRSCLIWNLLNPTSKINTGDYCYIFNTVLYSKDQLTQLSYDYPDIYKLLIENVFENPKMPELKKYGLKSIAIPISSSVKKIPEWIIPYIDYKNLTNKHLQPIITLLPSIEFKTSKFSGNKSTYSPLISF